MPFENSVFINCPFDKEYSALLRPLVFCVIYLGFEPRLAQTESSAEIRIEQIKQHIRSCRFGIHDLTRSKPLKHDDLPRFNMPYELGLDVGCASFGGRKMRLKRILVLEEEPYHYQKVLSHIAGQDIKHHNNEPQLVVSAVRDWFSTLDKEKIIEGYRKIWASFNKFNEDLQTELIQRDYTQEDIDGMPVSDFIKFVNDWVNRFKL